MTSDEIQSIFDQLCAPFSPDDISWRVGSTNKKAEERRLNDPKAEPTQGQALAYIDARVVMDRLDAVVGPGNWQRRYTHADTKTVCEIGIRIGNEWLWKADGAGDTDMEAEKGALSDAFKRSAVNWGIGRYLYNLPSPWLPLERRQFTKDALAKLDDIHAAEARKLGWGGSTARANANVIRLFDSTIKHFVTQPSEAIEFVEKNKGTLANLPVEVRNHVNETLGRVGA